MPWGTGPAILIADPGITLDITVNTLPAGVQFDAWAAVGAPSNPVNLTINISNAANLGSLLISSSFHPSSTFIVNLTGAGRAVGRGGAGNKGALYFNGQPFPAGDGHDALNAAIESAYDFSLDTDDGFVTGGGGGGGGGGSQSILVLNGGGGGGGGGVGWNNASGGHSGSGQFPDTPGGGTSGDINQNGLGGAPSPADVKLGDGGDGGGWGLAGSAGDDPGGAIHGTGGAGGLALEGSPGSITVTLTGAKNEATLISENRLLTGSTQVTIV